MQDSMVTILVVDDEVDICDLVALRLESEGFNVLKANSGNEALEIIEKEDIDLVVSDMRMPDGDGAFLLEQTKQRDHRKPAFLIVTGFTDMELDDAYNKGAEGILKKPIDFSNLIEIVHDRLINTASRFQKGKSKAKSGSELVLEFESLEEGTSSGKIKVGSGGVFVGMDSNFPDIHATVDLKVSFKSGEKGIQGRTICRWRRIKEQDGLPPGIGLEFLELDENASQWVSEYVNQQKIRAYIPNS